MLNIQLSPVYCELYLADIDRMFCFLRWSFLFCVRNRLNDSHANYSLEPCRGEKNRVNQLVMLCSSLLAWFYIIPYLFCNCLPKLSSLFLFSRYLFDTHELLLKLNTLCSTCIYLIILFNFFFEVLLFCYCCCLVLLLWFDVVIPLLYLYKNSTSV